MANDLINQQDNEGNTPLHIAAGNSKYKKIKNILLASSFHVQSLKNKAGCTFLDIAKALAVREFKELFAAAETSATDYLFSQIPGTQMLTTRNGQRDTACHVALRKGHLQFASSMIAIHPPIVRKVNAEGDPVLHFALKMGHLSELIEQVRSLLAPQKLDDLLDCMRELVNAEGKSLVYSAAEYEDVRAVRTLTELPVLEGTNGLRTDGPNELALHVAVRNKNYDVTQLLLQYNKNLGSCHDGNGHELVDVRSRDGLTPLHLAASMNNLEMFQLLLRHCPKCYLCKTISDRNVLHLAVQKNAAEIVEFIVKDKKMADALINQQDNEGNTPLHIAVSDGNKKTENILLATPAKVLPHKNNENLTFLDISKAVAARKKREKQLEVITVTRSFHSGLLVVATLITTVTFTAAFTMPGGYKGDGDDRGVANLAGKAAFKVFIIADAISMCSSIIATSALVLSSVITTTQKKFLTLMVAISSIVISIIFMLLAFTVGIWVVIPDCKWLVIVIVVITSCAPFVLVLVLTIIAAPSESEDDAAIINWKT